jgi:hypothetical protein
MCLKTLSALLLLLLGGCSGAAFSEPPMPAPSRDEGPEDDLEPQELADVGAARRDQPPVAQLRSPGEAMRCHVGSTVTFEGRGTDLEDGGLPASAFTWWVNVHEGGLVYPFIPPLSGMARGTFTVPPMGATSTPRWYRIHLQVKDSHGNTSAVYRDVSIEDTEPADPGSVRVR